MASLDLGQVRGTQGAQGIQGQQGIQGIAGSDGTNGEDGVGVPDGGTTGQYLKKASGTDYDTVWGDIVIPEIVDNLTTNDSTKSLSAKQGYTLNSNINTIGSTRPKAIYVYYAPTTGATANTAIDVTSEVGLPSGAIVRGIAVQCIYGGSAADYNATVVFNPTTNKFLLYPTVTQTPIRAYFTVFYTD